MKGLYQILAEDYRDSQIKETIKSNRLVESSKKVAKKKSLKESTSKKSAKNRRPLNRSLIESAEKQCRGKECKEEDKEVIKGSEEEKTDKKTLVEEGVKEEEKEEIVEEPVAEEVVPDEVEEDTPEEVLSKIAMVAGLSKEEIENAMAELPDEEKEAVKANFVAIKNTAMDLFPEEVAEDVEEITEEIPEEIIEEEPLEECEITSFKVTRIAPKVGAVMIEAQTKEGLKYITGKNFNESEKTLDEAEISTDKNAAANRFKGFLK